MSSENNVTQFPLRTKFSYLTDRELLKFRDVLTPGESPLLDELFIRLEKKIERGER